MWPFKKKELVASNLPCPFPVVVDAALIKARLVTLEGWVKRETTLKHAMFSEMEFTREQQAKILQIAIERYESGVTESLDLGDAAMLLFGSHIEALDAANKAANKTKMLAESKALLAAAKKSLESPKE